MPVSPTSTTLSRLVANRFAYGWTPALEAEMRRAGGPRAWFVAQLAAPSDPFRAASRAWWPALQLHPVTRGERATRGGLSLHQVGTDYSRWVLARRVFGRAQVLEVVQEFWENHLHVPLSGDAAMVFRPEYGDVVRTHALGRVDQLLAAAVTHPAMGIFLDNAVSSGAAPNENLGRELLELHTVGLGQHGEADVKAAARILSGWRVDVRGTWSSDYDPAHHATGAVSLLGFSDPNTSRDGRDLTRRFLAHLARHEATARRLARKLAVQFVRDDPSEELVDRLASVYLAHDTAVVPVLLALVDSPEFLASEGRKLRTPDGDVVAAYRALGIRYGAPRSARSAANVVQWQARSVGLYPYRWPRPDGRPAEAAPWAGAARVMASFDVHWKLAAGYYPTEHVTYRRPASWLPARRVRFSRLVDHLSRCLTGRPADAALRRACARAAGVTATTVVSADHVVVRHRMHRLLATVLDSPSFLVT